VLAVGAVAQDHQMGSLVKSRQFIGAEQGHATAVTVAHFSVRCAVRHRPDAARYYLSASSDAERARWDNGLFGRELSCGDIPGMASFATESRISQSIDIKRGMMAEALLGLAKIPPLSVEPLQRVYHAEWQPASGRPVAVDEMAVCIAATNPVGVEALLATTPEATDEMQAISALSPSMHDCLAANARLTSNRESLRAALAEALYHRVAGPSPTAVVANSAQVASPPITTGRR
jgi:hypothetical protein